VRRLLTLAFILKGQSRTEAAKQSEMERQTLRDWVHRYNLNGIDDLTSGHCPRQPPAVTAAQMGELKALVMTGSAKARITFSRVSAVRAYPAVPATPCATRTACRISCI
jgi:transposase